MLRVLNVALATCVLAAGPGVAGQGITPAELFPDARFDEALPAPAEFLGRPLGMRPLRHAEVMAYLEALAEASPRARLMPYARSHEGRQLVALAVSVEARIADLEQVRAAHATRVDPRGRAAAADAAALAEAPAVAWMAYGIHGDELSSVDAAVALAYWLVAGEDSRAARLRERLVVLIDPMENPDGRDRYLAQTASFASRVPNSDSQDLSHTTVWPWGRGNHYLFDLNRDWFTLVQPESARTTLIASWNPQLMVDSHEMGSRSSYLFSPPRHPFNPHLPDYARKWWQAFGADQAASLDARGYPYFTREWNEEFFPGYGSSWASYRGAIGILYEMSRTSGTEIRKPSGVVRTFPQAIEHHVVSSMANLETLADNREDMLSDFVAERRRVISGAGREGRLGAWVLPRSGDAERTDRLVDLLDRQGIEVALADDISALRGLHDIYTGEAVEAERRTGEAWVVRLDQPAAALIRTILDPHVPMDATFFREERRYLEREQGSRLYDVTAWSLILAYGVDAYWTRELPDVENGERTPASPSGGVETSGESPVAWVLDGTSDRSVSALGELLARGLSARLAGRPFKVEGRDYNRGAVILPVEGNPDDLQDRLNQVGERWSVTFRPTATGLAEEGPDLGGSHFHPLVAPRVGVWTGDPVSPGDYGALWHLLDEQMGLRFSSLDIGRFRSTDLDKYNVLVFPPVRGAAYLAQLGDRGRQKLKDWIEAGGTVIGIGSGADFLAHLGTELTKTKLRRQALTQYPPVVLGPRAEVVEQAGPFRAVGIRADDAPEEGENGDGDVSEEPAPYDVAPVLGPGARPFAEGTEQGTPLTGPAHDLEDWLRPLLGPGKIKAEQEDLDRADARLRRFSPQGAFVQVDLDPDVWLTWGMPERIPALVRASDTLVAESPVQVAARFADLERLHLGGLLWPEAAGRLARTAYATREARGRGQIILFLNDPNFRGWTLATRRMLQNAILYGPGLGTRWSPPW